MENKERIEKLQTDLIDSLIELRKRKKYTQKTLSEKTGIMRETIARIETGISSPQINTLLKILEPLGYTLKIKKITR